VTGASGASGLSGASGKSGASGASGASGKSGASGVSGATGATGTSATYIVTLSGGTAYCNGAAGTDHSTAINDCIDAADADGGGEVLIRSGTYTTGLFNLALENGVGIRGVAGSTGATATRIKPATKPTSFVFNIESNTYVEGLIFDATDWAVGATSILNAAVGDLSNVRIENNEFYNGGTVNISRAFYISDSTAGRTKERIIFRNNTINYSGGGYAIYAQNIGGIRSTSPLLV